MERERKYQEVFENKNKREKDGPSRETREGGDGPRGVCHLSSSARLARPNGSRPSH